jgi:RNA polymerase sigma factor (sigma-70 family)
MKMTEITHSDDALLKDWLATRSEAAFRALVGRYAGLVHMAAMRTCGDASLADEASQNTFITLAEKAATLASRKSLAGWLHLTAVMQAKNLHRKQLRDSSKIERFHLQMDDPTPDQAAIDWGRLSPLLDEALATLPAKDRDALLLRFYRSLSIQDVAATLGIAHAAAQKRVNRATERLRRIFERKGVQTSGSLGAVMAAGFRTDAQAASTLIDTLTHKALAASAAGTTATLTTTIIILMKKKATLTAAAILLAGGGSIYLIHQNNQQAAARVGQLQAGADTQPAPVASDPSRPSSITPARSATAVRSVAQNRQFLNDFARLLENHSSRNAAESNRIEKQIKEMDAQTLKEVLLEAAQMTDLNPGVIACLLNPLARKSPSEATVLGARLVTNSTAFNNVLAVETGSAFRSWLAADPAAAEQWYLATMAAGDLIPKSIPKAGSEANSPERYFARIHFEYLLASDPEKAVAKVKTMMPAVVAAVFKYGPNRPELVARIASQLPAQQQFDAAGATAYHMAKVDYQQAADWVNSLAIAESARDDVLAGCARRSFLAGKLSRTEALKIIDGLPASEYRDRARELKLYNR